MFAFLLSVQTSKPLFLDWTCRGSQRCHVSLMPCLCRVLVATNHISVHAKDRLQPALSEKRRDDIVLLEFGLLQKIADEVDEGNDDYEFGRATLPPSRPACGA